MTDPGTTYSEAARREVAALFEMHGASLYRFARAIVLSTEDAKDVVQETFVRLLAHLDRSGDTTNLKSWLFTVSANACRDVLRSRRRWLPWGPEHERRIEPDEGLLDDRRQLLEEAARRLPARDRMLLALRAQGSTYRDIATVSGIREQSVGRLLARATSRWQRECRRMMANDHEYLPDGHRTSRTGGR